MVIMSLSIISFPICADAAQNANIPGTSMSEISPSFNGPVSVTHPSPTGNGPPSTLSESTKSIIEMSTLRKRTNAGLGKEIGFLILVWRSKESSTIDKFHMQEENTDILKEKNEVSIMSVIAICLYWFM